MSETKIITGDCLEKIQQIKDGSIDMVFADPPFNLEKNYLTYKDKLELDEYLSWTKKWVAHCVRVLKPSGSIFIYNIPKLLTYTSAMLNDIAFFRHWIAWKSNGCPLGKTLQPSHYGILFYVKDKNKFKYYDVRKPHEKCRICKSYLKDYGGKEYLRHEFGTLIGDVWDDIHRVRHNKRRITSHPCQLPVHLVERIILLSTDPGDVVLDPFLGAGTTAMACKRLGRDCIGIEIDKEYVKLSTERIDLEEEIKHNNIYLSVFLNKIVSIRHKDLEIYYQNEKSRKNAFQ